MFFPIVGQRIKAKILFVHKVSVEIDEYSIRKSIKAWPITVGVFFKSPSFRVMKKTITFYTASTLTINRLPVFKSFILALTSSTFVPLSRCCLWCVSTLSTQIFRTTTLYLLIGTDDSRHLRWLRLNKNTRDSTFTQAFASAVSFPSANSIKTFQKYDFFLKTASLLKRRHTRRLF